MYKQMYNSNTNGSLAHKIYKIFLNIKHKTHTKK